MIEWIYRLEACTILVGGIVDNKSTVEAIHSTKAVSDKLLRINVGAVKEFLKKGLVNSIRWCDSSTQIASGHILLNILQSGCQKDQIDNISPHVKDL